MTGSTRRPPALDLLGIDFTSAPSRRKPITVAHGRSVAASPGGVRLWVDRLERLPDWAAFEALLARPGPWTAAFDLPFGLPRELVEHLAWPADWSALIDRIEPMSRAQLREAFAAFCAARPAGDKFAHRACDASAGCSPSMKWVNPPVAFMLHAGAPRLKRAGVAIPSVGRAQQDGGAARIALEGYPGLVARSITRASYKNDAPAKQTPARRAERARIVEALAAGRHRLGVAVELDAALAGALVDDGSADLLDAVLCLVQAAWAHARAASGFGLPARLDRLEGWIVGAVDEPVAGGRTAPACLERAP